MKRYVWKCGSVFEIEIVMLIDIVIVIGIEIMIVIVIVIELVNVIVNGKDDSGNVCCVRKGKLSRADSYP